ERVVLFLERSGPYHRVVGLAQGVYRVVPVEGSKELRAVPASLEGLELVSPAGQTPAARAPLSLSALRTSVQAGRWGPRWRCSSLASSLARPSPTCGRRPRTTITASAGR